MDVMEKLCNYHLEDCGQFTHFRYFPYFTFTLSPLFFFPHEESQKKFLNRKVSGLLSYAGLNDVASDGGNESMGPILFNFFKRSRALSMILYNRYKIIICTKYTCIEHLN